MSHVPADVPFVRSVMETMPPEGTETIKVVELLFTAIVPLLWLLLNEKEAPTGSVVAFGS